ncbi:uncharacterized protein BO95DRAFT_444776 [Aspergillus brunneoviolaceus CBS 621.78]|uniref:Uncharacterized protein n=1 Tax=Aspergillus brunneoviolaceus CBS 621.78 TaxID=1450534 RepID=A0ACD1G3T1_9EURO|nr:hypothetical protein BO95DRAFT_444776 [Aspergillus brunneoviolaceus CBS 621.78]RAH43819.1 hypothetical protein BO95DRAFT_444776 [Aspergillus brunneoviolaceus CBS 621.78]
MSLSLMIFVIHLASLPLFFPPVQGSPTTTLPLLISWGVWVIDCTGVQYLNSGGTPDGMAQPTYRSNIGCRRQLAPESVYYYPA